MKYFEKKIYFVADASGTYGSLPELTAFFCLKGTVQRDCLAGSGII
jgi:hypothetical protein